MFYLLCYLYQDETTNYSFNFSGSRSGQIGSVLPRRPRFPTEGIIGTEFEHGAVAFFDLQNGLKLALWPRESLSFDSGIPQNPPSATEFTLGNNVTSKEEVDMVMEQARQASAHIVKPAADTFWGGYAGYFQDPDGHLWEVVLKS